MNRSSFTLIELLIVIAVIMIIGSMSTPFVSRTIADINFKNTVSNITSYIYKSQSYSMNSKDNAEWGLCIYNNHLRLYKNNCSDNNLIDSYQIPKTVNVSGLDTIKYNRRGEPDNETTITISTPANTKTITINLAGGININ